MNEHLAAFIEMDRMWRWILLSLSIGALAIHIGFSRSTQPKWRAVGMCGVFVGLALALVATLDLLTAPSPDVRREQLALDPEAFTLAQLIELEVRFRWCRTVQWISLVVFGAAAILAVVFVKRRNLSALGVSIGLFFWSALTASLAILYSDSLLPFFRQLSIFRFELAATGMGL